MRTALNIDELGSHPHSVATPLRASFQRIAHAEIAAKLSHKAVG